MGYRMNFTNPFASNDLYVYNSENIGDNIVKRQEAGFTVNTGLVEVVAVAVVAAIYLGVPAAIASGVATVAEVIMPYIPSLVGSAGVFFITWLGFGKANECDG